MSENIAHADTPGYRARDIADFAAIVDERPGLQRPDDAGRGTSPSAPTRAASSRARRRRSARRRPNGNSVSLEDQMMRAAEVRQEHDLALGVYAKSLDDPARHRRPTLRAAHERDDEDDGGLGQRHGGAGGAHPALAPRTSPTPTRPATSARRSPSRRRSTRTGDTRARWRPARSGSTGASSTRVYDPTNPLAGPTDGYFEARTST